MKRKIIIVLLTAVLLLSSVIHVYAVDDTIHLNPDGWNVIGNYYKNYVKSNISANSRIYLITDEGYMAFNSDWYLAEPASDQWFPTTVVNADQTTHINDKLSIIFRTNTGFAFGNHSGYNGCVSVGFTSEKLTAIPTNLSNTRYGISTGAGLTQSGSNIPGYYVTLFPASDGSAIGTSVVSLYQITRRTSSGAVTTLAKGTLPREIDLSLEDNMISIEGNDGSNYGIFVNGMKIGSITGTPIITEGYLSFGITGAFTYSSNSFTIKDMNGYNAESYGAAYDVMNLMEDIPPAGYITEADIANISEVKSSYNALSASEKSKVDTELYNRYLDALAFLGLEP